MSEVGLYRSIVKRERKMKGDKHRFMAAKKNPARNAFTSQHNTFDFHIINLFTIRYHSYRVNKINNYSTRSRITFCNRRLTLYAL